MEDHELSQNSCPEGAPPEGPETNSLLFVSVSGIPAAFRSSVMSLRAGSHLRIASLLRGPHLRALRGPGTLRAGSHLWRLLRTGSHRRLPWLSLPRMDVRSSHVGRRHRSFVFWLEQVAEQVCEAETAALFDLIGWRKPGKGRDHFTQPGLFDPAYSLSGEFQEKQERPG